MLKNLHIRFRYELFALIAMAVVLWQMLLPGYVLTLDLVFGPHIHLPVAEGHFINSLPLWFILSSLAHVLSAWLVEKFALIALFFLLFYIPLRYLPISRKYGAEYAAATLYAINPFVYERFLAGQWTHLLAYALLPALVDRLITFTVKPSLSRGLSISALLLVIGIFSLHFLVMASIIVAVSVFVTLTYFLAQKDKRAKALPFFKYAFLSGILLVAVSLYWIIPYLQNINTSPLGAFDSGQWQAFATSAGTAGAIGNVLGLYGFWAEAHAWGISNVWPADISRSLFCVSSGILLLLMVVGAFRMAKKKEARPLFVWYALIGLFVFIFSIGIGPSMFKGINLWLFEHVGFWRGFRDTEKWSGWLALVYAIFFGFGADWFLGKLHEYRNAYRLGVKTYRYRVAHFLAIIIFISLPVLYTYPMLLGFSGQIKPVWYPSEWNEANQIFDAASKNSQNSLVTNASGTLTATPCKVLFLPWQQYYTLDFNNYLLTANTSSSYFDCTVLGGQDMALGGIESQQGNTPEYYALEKVVTSNTLDPDQAIQYFKRQGIQYIIYTDDVAGEDPYVYPFLRSGSLKKLITSKELYLFQIL